MSVIARVVSRAFRLPPPTHRRVARQYDLPLTLSDGTVLLANRWYPEGHETGLPTLLMRSPYGRSGLMTFEAELFAERGYNVIVQSVRGTHGSGGRFDAFANEMSDGAETLRWVHEQPWCDGRVGLAGGSYLGYTQFAAAAAATDGQISAMAPAITSADLRCLLKPYEAFGLDGAGRWIHGLDPEAKRKPLASLRHALSAKEAMAQAARHLPLGETDVVLYGEELPFFRAWIESATDAPYWDSLDARAGHTRHTTPVCLHAGWFDIFAPGQLADAVDLLRAGRDVRLTIGPWSHTGGSAVRFRESLAFYDETLHGRVTRRDPRPVRVQLYGDKRWWAFESWPPPTEARQWYLHADGRIETDPPTHPRAVEWTDDPADPAPSCGGPTLLKGGAVDNAKRESRPDVVVFTSAPLTEDVVVLGTPRFRARADADTASYDVVVRLCVVDEKGVSRNISDGLQRLDGGEADINIAMWPIGARIKRGQRIRIQVAGSIHPLWARNLHSGEDPAKGTTAIPAHQRLLLGPESPAVMELPIMRLGTADLARD
jgi:putative CocE/NonD family hydrolase